MGYVKRETVTNVRWAKVTGTHYSAHGDGTLGVAAWPSYPINCDCSTCDAFFSTLLWTNTMKGSTDQVAQALFHIMLTNIDIYQSQMTWELSQRPSQRHLISIDKAMKPMKPRESQEGMTV
jgi:hypothetical protein